MLDRTADAEDDFEKKRAAAATSELGSAGLRAYSGIIYEEYHKDLRGRKAIDVFRRMADSDPTVGACLLAFYLILRAVEWRTEPAKDSGTAGEAEAEFVDSIFDDMNVTWEDFLSEVLTMLIFGWHYSEIVLKKRMGPDETDPAKRSKFTDGRIGIRKLAPRPQDTLSRWEIQEDGGIEGMWQWPPTSAKEIFIPIERALLFRTTSNKNNPEGRSVLRSAYRSWQKLTVIEDAEAVGIERELAGLPIAYIPAKCLKPDATPGDVAFKTQITKLVRDVKYNEQAGVVLPSDTFHNDDGSFSNVPQVKFELLTSGGRRMIDTNVVVMRHQRSIARSVLADFLMLGQDKGAFNLGENKTDLFYRACDAVINQIAAPINEYLLPRIWAYNGLDWNLMPKRVPGRIAPVDLQQIGDFLSKRASAGDTLFPDPQLSEWLNEVADMPPPSEELMKLGEDAIEEGTVGPGAEAKLKQQEAEAMAANGGQQPGFPADTDPRKKPPFPFSKAVGAEHDLISGLRHLLRKWDESKHPRHPSGSSVGGEFAPAGGGIVDQLIDAVTGARESERDQYLPRAQAVVKEFGVDPDTVAVTDVTREFELNGKKYNYAGHYDPKNAEIMIYRSTIRPDSVEHVASHEAMHARYDALKKVQADEWAAIKDEARAFKGPPLTDAQRERMEMLGMRYKNSAEGGSLAPLDSNEMAEYHGLHMKDRDAREGDLDKVMRPDGTLREPWDKKYPVYSEWEKVHSVRDLPKEDGVSDYSRQYWLDKDQYFDRQVDETLAEIGRIKYQTGRLPKEAGPTFRKLYKLTMSDHVTRKLKS